MLSIIASMWALLIGIALMQLGIGLYGTLLGIRATMEGFPTLITGVVMSSYFVGFLVGSTTTPMLLRRVGHVRVYAALTSLVSVTVLLHAVLINPYFWGALRLLTGLCCAGLYVVAESWLNNISTNNTRGRILSVYVVVQLMGVAGGQFLLNLADPEGFKLFILISVLISISLVPILLSIAPAPSFSDTTTISLRELVRSSPLGVVAVVGSGMINGAMFGMGAVFAERIGLSLPHVSLFMVSLIVGGIVLQWPIGHLSDHTPRRTVIGVVALMSAGVALSAATLVSSNSVMLFLLAALLGGLTLPIYSLGLALTSDQMTNDQMTAAGSGLMLFNGVGAIFGPLLSGIAMTLVGGKGFFWSIAAMGMCIGLFTFFRMLVKSPILVKNQSVFVPIPLRTTLGTAVLMSEQTDEPES